MVQYLKLLFLVAACHCQDYQVADISCEFPEAASNVVAGELSAKLRKPPGFIGHPLFADERYINPQRDPYCQIRRDPKDRTGMVYFLLVSDLNRCGVTKKDGYVNVRVWFPQLNGVVLATDQEVIIMCKPASPTIIENRAAGFAGSLPSIGRVTGVVEESPGRLEYEVVLLKESQGRSSTTDNLVDQAVPIGSRLQLRARINTKSAAWKFAKLMEVSVSTDPLDGHAPGHVVLVKNGCRRADFRSIVPHQPKRSETNFGEVVLEFQAFMLDSGREGSSQLWIHATIKACVMQNDCEPDACLDQQDPLGMGKRRRRSSYRQGIPLKILPRKSNFSKAFFSDDEKEPEEVDYIYDYDDEESSSHFSEPERIYESPENVSSKTNNRRPRGASTQVGDNVGLEVIFPEKYFAHTLALRETCNSFMVLSTCLGVALLIAVSFLCFLTARMQKSVERTRSRTLDTVIREHRSKYGAREFLDPPFQ